MSSLNSCWKSGWKSVWGKVCVLVSTEEQLSGEDSTELTIQVSKKASPSVWGMLPSTIFLALLCTFTPFLSPKIDDPFMCQSSCLFSVFSECGLSKPCSYLLHQVLCQMIFPCPAAMDNSAQFK